MKDDCKHCKICGMPNLSEGSLAFIRTALRDKGGDTARKLAIRVIRRGPLPLQAVAYRIHKGTTIRASGDKWTINSSGYVFNKKGKWVDELMPSNRSDEHLTATRFDSAEDAYMHYLNYFTPEGTPLTLP